MYLPTNLRNRGMLATSAFHRRTRDPPAMISTLRCRQNRLLYIMLQIDHYYIIILPQTGLNGRSDKAHARTADGIRVQPVVCVSCQLKRNRSMPSSVWLLETRRVDDMSALYNLSPGNSPARLIKLPMTTVIVAVMAAMTISIEGRFFIFIVLFLFLLFRSTHLLSNYSDGVVALSRKGRKLKQPERHCLWHT